MGIEHYPHKWSKVRVVIWEMDRFSGRKVLDRLEIDDKTEAEQYVRDYNARNNEKVTPDYYTYAEIVG